MTDTLRIDLASGEATAIVSDNAGAVALPEEKEKKTALVVGLTVGGTVVILLVVLVPWLVVRRKRV